MTDIEQGREALRFFHNYSLKYDAYTPESLDDLLNMYGKKRDIYLDGIGMVIRENAMSPYTVEGSMAKLARTAEGKIPKDHQGYISALGNQAGQINWLDLTATVVTETTSQIVSGVQAVGDNVVSTLKIANWLWPIALFAFLALWYQSKVKKYT